ncbi:hypothetical protein D9757_007377 [Collybiopsis confluens]|uniref:E2 ubiquitin-conjugating enzyme n=1 Tax=Collybiopsis confluens TaxID=2823264 RepID=A0A8H5M7X8_9AGAR|nr:hypothetical protein D9757_007377 [Collybiopsis confluens]
MGQWNLKADVLVATYCHCFDRASRIVALTAIKIRNSNSTSDCPLPSSPQSPLLATPNNLREAPASKLLKMSISPQALRRLMREISELKRSPPEGIRIQDNDDDSNMLDVVGIIQGPEGTPYAGGYFRVKFLFTPEFPASPPKCTLLTKIFHPNVSSSGEICVNTLKRDWKSTYGIEHILVTVKCLLIYPNPESALDEEAGKLLLEDYDAYASRAKLITGVHATPRGGKRPTEFDIPSREDAEKADPSSPNATPAPSTAVATSSPSSSSTSSSSSASRVGPPIITAPPKSSTNIPSSVAIPFSLTVSPKKDTSTGLRHVSPSPLAPADANIEPSIDKSLSGKNSNGGRAEKDKLGIINGGGMPVVLLQGEQRL